MHATSRIPGRLAVALAVLLGAGPALAQPATTVQLNVPSAAPGAAPVPTQRRTSILVTGSSTVFPFTNLVAEKFAQQPGRSAPVINSTGTVRGYNLFCQGAGLRYPDIQNASRRMNNTEFRLCTSRGVHEVIEIPIGYDGMVVAFRREVGAVNLTRAQIWRAVAKQVPVEGNWIANPYTRWRQIDASLPDFPIMVFGPPPTSGTRDSFTDLVLNAGCQAVPEVRQITDVARKRTLCTTLREDGRWVDAGEDDAKIVERIVSAEPGAVQGVFGYSFLVNNADRLEGAAIEGVEDTQANIASGAYPLARPLFIYVKRPNLALVPGLREFLAEYLAAIEPGGPLDRIGLAPLEPGRLRQARDAVQNQAIMLRQPEG